MRPRSLLARNYSPEDLERIANAFLVGNGRVGYKGTREEFGKEERATFSLIGTYDQRGDKWREPINLFDPLGFSIRTPRGKIEEREAIRREFRLDMRHGIVYRRDVYEDIEVRTERFCPYGGGLHLLQKIEVRVRKGTRVLLSSFLTTDIHEINGPHVPEKSLSFLEDGRVLASGRTNEGREASVFLREEGNIEGSPFHEGEKAGHRYEAFLPEGGKVVLRKIAEARIDGEIEEEAPRDYEEAKRRHSLLFEKAFEEARALLPKDGLLQKGLDHAAYSLLILGNHRKATSIPARGLSGQVYKGAIFWDTEMFLLPFYLLTDMEAARLLVQYRINTLPGALLKAREFGFEGAFYAWESQEDGKERCSLYNVTDPRTGEPIRTYFADCQIHISIDVFHGLMEYVRASGDLQILEEGGKEVLREVVRFYRSRASLGEDGLFHFKGVIGPDEYHELVDDNAYTNAMVRFEIEDAVSYLRKKGYGGIPGEELGEWLRFARAIYLQKPGKDGVIEQFAGYLGLEDVRYEEFRKRIEDPKEYLGGKEGKATPTRVIKQADVVALLALHPERYSLEALKKNLRFYEPYTEGGSSLSNSMYGLLSAWCGDLGKAVRYMRESALTDIRGSKKMFAGGIYIGGSHPAAMGGAYLDLARGFLGARIEENKVRFSPRLPERLKGMRYRYKEGVIPKERKF